MEIEHASLAMVQTGRNGERVLIENDVLDIVKQLKEISKDLYVRWNERGEYFVIYEMCKDGTERLVTTCMELDQRLVDHMRKIGSEGWNRNLIKEMERAEDEDIKNRKHAFAQKTGEIAERLHHALRKDREIQNKVHLSGRDNGKL